MTPAEESFILACKQFGPQVGPLPDGIDGTQLLWALGGNESSFGVNTTPRHEPEFDVGGTYGRTLVMLPLLEMYGAAAACSYGRWQLMFCNAPQGATPEDFINPQTDAQYAVAYLNSLLRRFRPQSLTQIGQCWNAGHTLVTMGAGVAAYVKELQTNYNTPIPEAVNDNANQQNQP